MSTLAEDLLKSRSIADLRGLILDLQSNVERKRADLQSMVGSQYHEFVQSADKIDRMRDQSAQLCDRLESFWARNQQVVRSVGQLLDQDSPARAQPSLGRELTGRGSLDRLIPELRPSAVWKDLSVCDIYAATVKAVGAYCLVHRHEPPAVARLLSSDAQLSVTKKELSLSAASELSSSAFLIDTIIDDAKIFCLEDASDGAGLVEQKAKALASLSLLYKVKPPRDNPSVNEDIVEVYLHCAEMRIQELFATNLRQDKPDVDIEGGLLSLVQLLQTIVVDIYMLFVFHVPLGDGQHVNGLVSLFQLQVARDVDELFAPSDAPLDTKLLDARETKQRMRTARSWLHDQIKQVTEECSSLLRSLNSATQVAQLQQQVYASCCRASSAQWNLLQKTNLVALPPFAQIWRDACAELLIRSSIRHQRSLAPHREKEREESFDAALVLWSTVFRASFLHQVERLLQRACEDILRETQRLVLSELSSFGVDIDLDSQEPKPQLSPSTRNCNAGAHFVAAKLFAAAERVRGFFDSSLGRLLDDVVTPVHQSELLLMRNQSSGDLRELSTTALSSQALMRALKGNCAQLVGQLLSCLRRIAESCRGALQTSGLLAWKESERSSGLHSLLSRLLRREFGVSRVAAADLARGSSPALSPEALSLALLFLGRIAWLLKLRSPATHHALSDDVTSRNTADQDRKRTGEDAAGAVSEEQFRSAFEIADTDGDGVVNHVEAREALQALSIGESDFSSHAPSALSAVASLSYDEFALVFGAGIFSSEHFRAQRRLHCALDHVFAFSHCVWAVFVALRESAPLEGDMNKELGLSLSANAPSLAHPVRFKSSWQKRKIEIDSTGIGEEDGESKNAELIAMPSRCCVTASKFLFRVTRAVNSSLVSVDAMQYFSALKTEKSIEGDDDEDDNPQWMRVLVPVAEDYSLCVAVSKFAYALATEQLCRAYEEIVKGALKCQGESSDDVLLQLIIDLKFLLLLVPPEQVSQARLLKDLIEQLNAAMDPIMNELVAQPINTVVQEIFDRNHMLLFPLRQDNSTSDSKKFDDLSPPHQSTKQVSSEQLISLLFPKPSNPTPRCALLPIAMTSVSNASATFASTNKVEKEVESRTASTVEDKDKTKPTSSNMMKWW